jgi:uncharacterized protein YlzI (FlbEa/FlbD family)
VSDTNFNLEERKTMKTRNQIIGMVLAKMFCILAAIITIAFITCKEDETDPKCNCPNGTEHLIGQPCCEGTDCKCVVYYGTLPNTTIKIYKGDATITDTQMTTVIARIQTSYTDGIIAGKFEADFQRIIKSIRVTLGANIVKNGNIIEFGCDAIEEYPGTAFAMIAMGETTGW